MKKLNTVIAIAISLIGLRGLAADEVPADNRIQGAENFSPEYLESMKNEKSKEESLRLQKEHQEYLKQIVKNDRLQREN